jgi:hypothetical protein
MAVQIVLAAFRSARSKPGTLDRSDRRPGGGCTSGANTGAPALLRGSHFARAGLACATALAVATRRADLGELNLRLSIYWHARSGFGRTGMLPGGFPSHVLLLTQKPRRVSPMGSANRSCQLSEKQYQLPAGLARNCRFFLSSVPALNSANWPRLGSAEPSLQPSPI